VLEDVAQRLAGCVGPTLAFDLRAIAANMRAVAEAASAARITPLFALKSFPLAAVRELAAQQLGGFDAASPEEVRAACAARGDGVLSIVDPSGAAIELAKTASAGRRVIVGCETIDQVRAAPSHVEIAIRVSASLTGRDPAVGAILDGSGHRRSRFGVAMREEIAELVKAAHGRAVGIHVHHGPVTATSAERFVASAQAARELFREASDRDPAFVNLGGAWHGVTDMTATLREVRAGLGNGELLMEPGRAYATGAGFATGRIVSTREAYERTISVCELSRVCHLRWSQPELVAPAPKAERRSKVVVLGPTCYEEDVIGEWIVDVEDVRDRIVLRNVTGYAVAWNTGFAGIAPATVLTLS
jgi:diaminopimelate decarboxylase